MRSLNVFSLALLLVGCTQETVAPPTAGHRSLRSEVCTILPPTQPGCPIGFSASEAEDNFATSAGSADGSEPAWYGQTEPSLTAPLKCPATISVATNKVWIPEYSENATFYVMGLVKVRDIGYSALGEPMAEYRVPFIETSSAQPLGKYKMLGGSMYGRCKVQELKVGSTVKVMVGPITWYNYDGEIFLAEDSYPGGGNDADRGWAFRDSQQGTTTGRGAGVPSDVVNRFLNHGECTLGWEIWVDQMMRCDAHGNMY